MKTASLILIFLNISLTLLGQSDKSPKNVYETFNEFQDDQPSVNITFQLKKRTSGDIFMTGGISNYRLKKISPTTSIDKVEKEIWGIIVADTVYINSYPYSRLKGYNKILGKGYYTYFIGEPARTEKEQRELGIIKSDEKQIAVCCQTGYVILPNGTVKHLRPSLLTELCQDNEEITSEIEKAQLKIEEVDKMFNILKKYNDTK